MTTGAGATGAAGGSGLHATAAAFHEVDAGDDTPLQIRVVGNAGIDNGNADPLAGEAGEPQGTGPDLVGADGLAGDRHRWAYDRIGRDLAHVGVARQGVELAAGHGDDAAAPQAALQLQVVALGQLVDLVGVAVDDDLHRLIGQGINVVGQRWRQLSPAGRVACLACAAHGRHPQRQRQAQGCRGANAAGTLSPPPV